MKAPARKTARRRPAKAVFYWWTPEKTAEIGSWIVANSGKRLEMRMDGEQVFFRMAATDGVQALDDTGDKDDSRVCPPICP